MAQTHSRERLVLFTLFRKMHGRLEIPESVEINRKPSTGEIKSKISTRRLSWRQLLLIVSLSWNFVKQ